MKGLVLRTGVLSFVCLLGLTSSLWAQQKVKLTGSVQGENEGALPYVTVVLLEAQDSTIAQFTTTNNKGNFNLYGVPQGSYIVQLSYVGYKMTYKPLNLRSDMDMGSIVMEQQDVDLDAVQVETDRIPITMENDTVAYNADAFKTQPNASVEDLLKQLPGVEVDQDGTVKAQGEEVQKVLVDGKEFFGDDPKMATKNLPADAIKKVQVFDQKSDMAQFSGVDDGQRSKTINLTLKDGKKHGYFGNVSGGYGYPNDRFEGKFNINQFSKKSQLSVLGMGNNINEQGFSLKEYADFMGGFRSLMQSGLVSTNGGGMPTVGFGGANSGITTVFAGGVNFNTTLSSKTQWTSSYFYNSVQNELSSNTDRVYFNNVGLYDAEEQRDEEETNQNHRVNVMLNHEVDSTQDLRLRSYVSFNDAAVNLASNQLSMIPGEGTVINSTTVDNLGSGRGMTADGNLLHRKKMKKKGRIVVTELNGNYRDELRGTDLDADYAILGIGNTLLQRQDYWNLRLSFGGKISYTEPLGKGMFLEFNLNHQQERSELDKDFFDVEPDSQLESFNTLLSNAYDNLFLYNSGGTTFKLNRDKFNFSLGVSAQQSVLDGELLNTNTEVNKRFFNVLPRMQYAYRFSNSKRASVNYTARINAPSLTQLQPLVDNSNPLQVYKGNPELQAEYAHSLRLRYMSFNQFSFINFFGMLRGTYTENKITNAVLIDSALTQYSQPMNVDYDLNISGHASFSAPIRPLRIKTSVTPTVTYNKGILFINMEENDLERWVSSLNWRVENRKKDKLDVRLGVKISHNLTQYAQNEQLNQSFISTNYYTDFIWYVKEGTNFSTSFDYTVFGGEAFATSEAIPLWKASVSQLFLKDKKAQVKFSVFDILNQNQGFTRNSTFNFVEETYANVLGRYFMVSLTYSLTGFKKEQKGWWGHGGRR